MKYNMYSTHKALLGMYNNEKQAHAQDRYHIIMEAFAIAYKYIRETKVLFRIYNNMYS